MSLGEGRESCVDLAFGAGFQDRELDDPLSTRRFLHGSNDCLCK